MINQSYNVASEFEQVYQKITVGKILDRSSSNELPIYIQTYPIEFEQDVKPQILLLNNRLEKDGTKTLHIDLYLLILNILGKEGVLDMMLNDESDSDKREFFEFLCGTLNQERIMCEIDIMISDVKPKIILFSGVAQLFPYIRAHNILNNLQPSVRNIPILFFYPGVYDNYRFDLFGSLNEDNYYRAHNLSNINL